MIGYYVHHQGLGHLHRAGAIIRHLKACEVTVLSSLPAPAWGQDRWVELPRDDDAAAGPAVDPTAGGKLHWVPLHQAGLRERMATISQWIRRYKPSFAVVDVSVEVALLFRLHGVPVIVVGMPGDRSDLPHQIAYDSAARILAPWAAEFARRDWPESWLAKTHHTGSISRFDGLPITVGPPSTGRGVLLLRGSGGAARALEVPESSNWTWTVAADLDEHGVLHELRQADVIVTHAGQNAVAEIAAVGRPAVIVPQPRPHDEQADTATILRTAGLAVISAGAPVGDDWDPLLHRAIELGGGGWQRWRAGGGAPAAARLLDDLAGA